MTPTRPNVLSVCVENAGRSQLAAGLLRDVADEVLATPVRDLHHRSAVRAGIDRMRPVRDDIGARVRTLIADLSISRSAP